MIPLFRLSSHWNFGRPYSHALFSTVFHHSFFLYALPITICFQLLSSLSVFHSSRLSQFIHLPFVISLYPTYSSDPVVVLPVISSPDALFSVSVSAGVPNTYIHDDTIQIFKTLSFNCFCSFLSHIIPFTFVHAAAAVLHSSIFLYDYLHHHIMYRQLTCFFAMHHQLCRLTTVMMYRQVIASTATLWPL